MSDGARAATLDRLRPPTAAEASEFRRALGRSLRRNRLATFAALIIAVTVLGAALAPRLPLADPDAVDTVNRLKPPLTPGHALGTDEFGRDLTSRLVWGARVSLLAGVAAAALAMTIGVVFVAAMAARTPGAPAVTITCTCRRIRSAAWRESASKSSAAR
jgi:ABC-type dipeptide/oligopeptide/nickel transport system permease subunit